MYMISSNFCNYICHLWASFSPVKHPWAAMIPRRHLSANTPGVSVMLFCEWGGLGLTSSSGFFESTAPKGKFQPKIGSLIHVLSNINPMTSMRDSCIPFPACRNHSKIGCVIVQLWVWHGSIT